jgi:hypothetical protein
LEKEPVRKDEEGEYTDSLLEKFEVLQRLERNENEHKKGEDSPGNRSGNKWKSAAEQQQHHQQEKEPKEEAASPGGSPTHGPTYLTELQYRRRHRWRRPGEGCRTRSVCRRSFTSVEHIGRYLREFGLCLDFIVFVPSAVETTSCGRDISRIVPYKDPYNEGAFLGEFMSGSTLHMDQCLW